MINSAYSCAPELAWLHTTVVGNIVRKDEFTHCVVDHITGVLLDNVAFEEELTQTQNS